METNNLRKIKPPFIALFCMLLAMLLNYLFPNLKLINQPYNKLGIAFIVLGFINLVWSFSLFKKNKTPIIPGQKPTFAVMEGPYSFTRNPMYLSITLALFGIALYIGNILAFIAPIIFFAAMNYVFIPFEENLMEDIFGRKYLDYKKKVRRWI